MRRGFEGKLLKEFQLTAILADPVRIRGNLVESGNMILLKIEDDFHVAMENIHFDFHLQFTSNKITYELQHNALKLFREHNLFEMLIENPIFNTPCAPKVADKNHVFT